MFVTNEYTLIIVLLFKDTVNVWSLDRRHAHLDHRLTVGNETYKPYHCETTLSTCGLTEVDYHNLYPQDTYRTHIRTLTHSVNKSKELIFIHSFLSDIHVYMDTGNA